MSFPTRPLAAALLCAGLAIPCFADAQSTVREIVVRPGVAGAEVRTERVSFTDLNLDRTAGAHTLLLRINGAAQRVCGPDEGSHSDSSFRTCVREAIDRAVSEVDNPLLTTLHRKH